MELPNPFLTADDLRVVIRERFTDIGLPAQEQAVGQCLMMQELVGAISGDLLRHLTIYYALNEASIRKFMAAVERAKESQDSEDQGG